MFCSSFDGPRFILALQWNVFCRQRRRKKQERVPYGVCCALLVFCGIIFAVINKKTVKINYFFLVFCVLKMFLKVMTSCIAVYCLRTLQYYNLSCQLLCFHFTSFLQCFVFFERRETATQLLYQLLHIYKIYTLKH